MTAIRVQSQDNTFRFRHSEALLRSVLENAAVATFLVSPNGQLLYANRAFYDLLAYDEDEPFSAAIDDLIYPDDAPHAHAQMQTLEDKAADGYRAERRYLKKDGEPIWVLVSASAIRDPATGEFHYLIVQAINIDRQKRAEAALAESESRWNFALESAGQGVWDHNLNAKTAFYSRMWRVMRGMDPDEEIDPAAESWLSRLHPDDRERIRNIANQQDTGELSYNEFEYRERHRDGHYIWILSRGKPVAWNPDGSPSRVIGTDTDITKIKRVESQLALEKERLKVTLESIADGVISTDAAGLVVFMNRVAEQMTGWPSTEAAGRKVGEIFAILDEKTEKLTVDPVAECLSQGRLHYLDGDTVLIGRDGMRRDVRASAAPVRTPQGAVIGAVLVFQDVADSRALQRQLAHTAMHDSLTGLPNRATFQRGLEDAARMAQREAREHALCFIDLDHFKTVNDSAGHAVGDAVLRDIGETIRACCRTHDFAARIGGDEFALLLPDCSVASATRVAQKVVDAIADLRFSWQHTREAGRIGASIGITAITGHSADPVELMRQADAACYVAKARGRNCVAVYDSDRSGLSQLQESA